jgi:hypothetical protein
LFGRAGEGGGEERDEGKATAGAWHGSGKTLCPGHGCCQPGGRQEGARAFQGAWSVLR